VGETRVHQPTAKRALASGHEWGEQTQARLESWHLGLAQDRRNAQSVDAAVQGGSGSGTAGWATQKRTLGSIVLAAVLRQPISFSCPKAALS
jgi:hypothetical protein